MKFFDKAESLIDKQAKKIEDLGGDIYDLAGNDTGNEKPSAPVKSEEINASIQEE